MFELRMVPVLSRGVGRVSLLTLRSNVGSGVEAGMGLGWTMLVYTILNVDPSSWISTISNLDLSSRSLACPLRC
jgi:hypothetical protein